MKDKNEIIDLKDFFINLFSNKYDKSFKLKLLSKLENEGELVGYIKEYHPKYYIEHRNQVMQINLSIDLGFV